MAPRPDAQQDLLPFHCVRCCVHCGQQRRHRGWSDGGKAVGSSRSNNACTAATGIAFAAAIVAATIRTAAITTAISITTATAAVTTTSCIASDAPSAFLAALSKCKLLH